MAFRAAEVNIYDFATDEVTSPWRAALERLHVWAPTEGLAEILPNDELFVEEQPHGRLIRLTRDGDVIWEYVNRAKMGRVFRRGLEPASQTLRPAPGSPRHWPGLIAAAPKYHRMISRWITSAIVDKNEDPPSFPSRSPAFTRLVRVTAAAAPIDDVKRPTAEQTRASASGNRELSRAAAKTLSAAFRDG